MRYFKIIHGNEDWSIYEVDEVNRRFRFMASKLSGRSTPDDTWANFMYHSVEREFESYLYTEIYGKEVFLDLL